MGNLCARLPDERLLDTEAAFARMLDEANAEKRDSARRGKLADVRSRYTLWALARSGFVEYEPEFSVVNFDDYASELPALDLDGSRGSSET